MSLGAMMARTDPELSYHDVSERCQKKGELKETSLTEDLGTRFNLRRQLQNRCNLGNHIFRFPSRSAASVFKDTE